MPQQVQRRIRKKEEVSFIEILTAMQCASTTLGTLKCSAHSIPIKTSQNIIIMITAEETEVQGGYMTCPITHLVINGTES